MQVVSLFKRQVLDLPLIRVLHPNHLRQEVVIVVVTYQRLESGKLEEGEVIKILYLCTLFCWMKMFDVV